MGKQGTRTATFEWRECQHCGARFEVRVSPSRLGRGLFCSSICQKRGRTHASREFGTNWKGGRRDRADGRVEVYVRPGEPFAEMRGANGYILEHRLVMARLLGRPLLRWESVHHIDGNPANNEAENLQLRLLHGQGQAYVCADCGSRHLRPVAL